MANFQGFIGSTYNAAASLQDNQLSINYYVEVDRNNGAKTPTALLSAPGLSDAGQSVYSGEVRGMHALPGGTKALLVVGTRLLTMTVSGTSASGRPLYTYVLIGTLLTGAGPVGISDNGAGNICVIVDGPYMYVYNTSAGTFARSTDPAFLGSNVVCEVDGWFVFAKPNSQIFYTSPIYWDGVAPFDGTYFALKDNAHDNIVTLTIQNREVWVIGSETTEVWYNAGNQYFPFSRLQGTMQQIGCAATASLSRHRTGLIWLGSSERGNNQVLQYEGYAATVISNPAMAYQINQYTTISDAHSYVYSEEGHDFYVLIFPTANATWVYDLTTGEWHNRASYNPVSGTFNRQRANCAISFQNTVIAGDYATGQIYWQSRSVYVDGNYPLVSVRRASHMWDQENRARMRHTRLEIEFKPGSAQQTGTFTNPQAILTWSDDGGQTFGNDHFASLGQSGQTKNRCIWRRLGIARDRVYQVTVSDPVNRDIVGASIMGEPYRT